MGNTLSAYKQTEYQLDLGDSKGSIIGTQYDSKSRRYVGIPYALPPTGDYRWKKPRPLPSDHTYSQQNMPFDATHFGPICPQALNYTSANKHLPPDNVYDEDCLRLNIWTPVETQGKRKGNWPVMLWLHGGWFQMGDPSHEPGMDPTELISTGGLDAIVVAIGYRLNVFGFLAGDALSAESGAGESGNYGLWDQRLAIEWVHENIASFGGDPNNVTLAGRSAGAYSVHAHTMFEFQKPIGTSSPFQRIVMISNAIPAQPKTPEECQDQFDELCNFFDIPLTMPAKDKLSVLRGIDADILIGAIMKLNHHTFRPVTDSAFILPGIQEYHHTGEFARRFQERKFRLFIGEMLNEETLYAVTNGPEPNPDSLALQISNYYAPATTTRVLQHYGLPAVAEKNAWTALYGNIIADGQVRAPSRFLVDSLVKHGVAIKDIWRYRISYRLSFITEDVASKNFGVAHAMDKPLWNFSIMHGPTEKELILMQHWARDLSAFVKDRKDYEYGTTRVDEFKVATPEGEIRVQEDRRWQELTSLANVFFG